MIDELKILIDECETKPKIKSILLQIAELPESNQNIALKCIKEILGVNHAE